MRKVGSARLKDALQRTNRQNAIRVLKSSSLPREEKLAVLAVRHLGAQEVQQSVNEMQEIAHSVITSAGGKCGQDCGDGCGNTCGWQCGFGCNGKVSSSGVFCGGSCRVQAGSIGVLDPAGKLGINFLHLDAHRLLSSMREAVRLSR